MKYFQFETVEFPQWQAAYENRETVAIVAHDGREITVPTRQSDEIFEKPFFDFLIDVLQSMEQSGKLDLLPRCKGFQLGVECVDGEHAMFWQMLVG